MSSYSFKKDDLPSEEDLKLTEEEQNKVDENQRETRRKAAEKIVARKLREEEERRKKFGEVKTGKRGGRYTEDVTKDGRPYRRYF